MDSEGLSTISRPRVRAFSRGELTRGGGVILGFTIIRLFSSRICHEGFKIFVPPPSIICFDSSLNYACAHVKELSKNQPDTCYLLSTYCPPRSICLFLCFNKTRVSEKNSHSSWWYKTKQYRSSLLDSLYVYFRGKYLFIARPPFLLTFIHRKTGQKIWA